jgi:1,4-dihydroxy-2-naphthoate octaprenyltransferase
VIAGLVAAGTKGPQVTLLGVIVSLLVGFTTTIILYCSHFHQHDGDKANSE